MIKNCNAAYMITMAIMAIFLAAGTSSPSKILLKMKPIFDPQAYSKNNHLKPGTLIIHKAIHMI